MNANVNEITLVGTIVSNPVFDHSMFGEQFYEIQVKSKRTSESCDTLVVKVSERLFDVDQNYVGTRVHVSGQIHSYNRRSQNAEQAKSRLMLYVFARDIYLLDDDEEPDDVDEAVLEGFICRPPTYRRTPLGREICDFCLAVNRNYGKSSYIPCIAWGRNAVYMSRMDIGTHMRLEGRFQSREHTKAVDGESVIKTVYEFSASRLEPVIESEE